MAEKLRKICTKSYPIYQILNDKRVELHGEVFGPIDCNPKL